MAAALALAAAVLFALGTVLMQRGTLETTAGAGDPRFYVQIFRRPAWLLGGVSTVLGGLLQMAALSQGPIIVVQPILTLSLVFALPLGAWLTDQRVGRREILGAIEVIAGLIVFLTLSSPHGGKASPSGQAWLIGGGITLLAAAVVARMARGRPPAQVAGLLGTAAGLAYGLEASILKLFTNQLSGVSTIFQMVGYLSTYALIVTALAGGALQQASLKTGALAPAMASVNVANMMASVALGIWVFGEQLAHGGGALFASLLGLALTAFGVLTLMSGRRAQSPPSDAGSGRSGRAAG